MFAPPVRSVFLRALVVMAVGLGLAACDETEIPSAPEATPTFSIFTFDTTTVLPASGASIASGAGQMQYRQRVFYQLSDADFNQDPETPLVLWLETENSSGWQGDLVFDVAHTQGQSGTVVVEGTFNMPDISPFCTAMSGLNNFSFVLTESEDLPDDGVAPVPRGSQLNNKSGFSQLFHFSPHQVTGAPTLTDPCAIAMESWTGRRFQFQWGEPVLLWGQRMLTDQAPLITFAGGIQQDFTVTIPAEQDGWNGWDLVFSWVPAASQAGEVSVAYWDDAAGAFVQTDYGAETPPFINVNAAAGDFFEPNDSWETPAEDIIEWGDFWFLINPGLAIDDVDLEINPDNNPIGLGANEGEEWGQGDWWALDIPAAMDVCVVIFMEENAEGEFDDQDLFLFAEDGTLLDFDITVDSDFAVVFTTTTGPTTLLSWISPWVPGIVTEIRSYEVYAFDCTSSSPPAQGSVTRPSAADKLMDLSDPGVRTHIAPRSFDALFRAVDRSDPGDLIRGLSELGVPGPDVRAIMQSAPEGESLLLSAQEARNASDLLRRGIVAPTAPGDRRDEAGELRRR